MSSVGREKILVIAPSWIGDCVMAQPSLALLRQQYPDATIHVFAPKWSLPVLKRMPEVDEVLENPFGHGELKLLKRMRLGRMLGKQGFTRALILPNSMKSALVPYFAKIPIRTGFVGEMRYHLINDIRVLNEVKLPKMVDRYTSLSYPATQSLPINSPMPVLTVDSQSQAASVEKFSLNLERPIVSICPGAEYGIAKRWPVKHFAQVVRQCVEKGWQVWYFGSHKDAPIAQEITELSGGLGINLCGKTKLDEAVDLLALSNVVLCNDSGLMHIAAALQRPIVVIYGSSSSDHTPPLSECVEILSLNLECSPCFERECPLGHMRCLEDLSYELVFDAINKLINNSLPENNLNNV